MGTWRWSVGLRRMGRIWGGRRGLELVGGNGSDGSGGYGGGGGGGGNTCNACMHGQVSV